MNPKLEEAASPARSPSPSPTEPAKASPAHAGRLTRDLILGGIGAFLLFLIMAYEGHVWFGTPVATLLTLVTAWCLLDAVAVSSGVLESTKVIGQERLAPAAAKLLGSAVLFVGSLWGGSQGVLWGPLTGLLLAASAIGVFAFGFELLAELGPFSVDETGKKRALADREGFWLMAAGSVLYFPGLGFASLWDPWETHYGEVAREIVQRNDWISTWWSWEGWFYSKPILGQWLQALAMSAMGVPTGPDKVLWDANAQRFLHPEWVVRTPVVLAALLGLYILYKGVAKHAGRRGALLGGLVLATCPQWWMLAHQTMTDMPLVAALCASFGFVLLGLAESDDSEVTSYSIKFGSKSLQISGWTLALGAVVVIVLPQIVYLLSRNVEFALSPNFGFRLHADEFHAGSPGNCELPGNPKCSEGHVTSQFEPAAQAVIWIIMLASIVMLQRRERKTKHLFYFSAWTMAGVATMAKALLGVCLPGCAVLLAFLMLRKWKEIPKVQIASGLATVAVLALPWGVAMFVRHGTAFTDELLFHDMFSRVLSHVHDTNDGIDTSFRYYLWQAGYGLFPWTGVVIFGLVSWLREPRRDAPLEMILVLWALVVFTLFSMMGTRFHHYIFPAIPPVAMLAGLALDRVLTGSKTRQDRMLQAASFVAAASFVLAISYDLVYPKGGGEAGPSVLMRLFTYQYKRAWPSSTEFEDYGSILQWTGVAFAVAMLSAGVYAWRKQAVYVLLAGSFAWALWGLNVYMPASSNHFGQRAVMEAYYRDRQSHLGTRQFSPNDADIVAYMLNWKGENFYTGNHIAQFTGGGAPFTNWVKDKKSKGAKLVYVATERNRVGAVTSQLGARHVEELTTAADSTQFVMLRADL